MAEAPTNLKQPFFHSSLTHDAKAAVEPLARPDKEPRMDHQIKGSSTPPRESSSQPMLANIQNHQEATENVSSSLKSEPEPIIPSDHEDQEQDTTPKQEDEPRQQSPPQDNDPNALTPIPGVKPGPPLSTGRTAARGGPSKFRGVVWHKSNCKWEARIYEGGKQRFLGYFVNELAAAMSYDDHAIRLHGNLSKLNFPERYEGVELPPPTRPSTRGHGGGGGIGKSRSTAHINKSSTTTSAITDMHDSQAAITAAAANVLALSNAAHQTRNTTANDHAATGADVDNQQQPSGTSSRYRGVSWNSNFNKWRAQVWQGTEVHHVGYFDKEEDAARSYDDAVLRIRGYDAPTNFPKSDYGVVHATNQQQQQRNAPFASTTTTMNNNNNNTTNTNTTNEPESQYHGVSWSKQYNTWISEIWDGYQYRLLGKYRTEGDAARAYDIACIAQHGANALTNYPMSQYETEVAALALRDLAGEHLVSQESINLLSGIMSPPPQPNGNSGGQYPVVQQQQQQQQPYRITSTTTAPPYGYNTNTTIPPPPPPQQQQQFYPSHPRSSSQYTGVSWDNSKQRWISRIQHQNRQHFLGYFENEAAAAAAYDAAAIRLVGPSSALNFPDAAPALAAAIASAASARAARTSTMDASAVGVGVGAPQQHKGGVVSPFDGGCNNNNNNRGMNVPVQQGYHHDAFVGHYQHGQQQYGQQQQQYGSAFAPVNTSTTVTMPPHHQPPPPPPAQQQQQQQSIPNVASQAQAILSVLQALASKSNTNMNDTITAAINNNNNNHNAAPFYPPQQQQSLPPIQQQQQQQPMHYQQQQPPNQSSSAHDIATLLDAFLQQAQQQQPSAVQQQQKHHQALQNVLQQVQQRFMPLVKSEHHHNGEQPPSPTPHANGKRSYHNEMRGQYGESGMDDVDQQVNKKGKWEESSIRGGSE